MEGVGSPASTARSVVREIPRRLAVSTVLSPWDFLRRLSLSPNWRSKWSCRTEESLEAFIHSVFWKNESMSTKALSTAWRARCQHRGNVISLFYRTRRSRAIPSVTATPGHQVLVSDSHESRKVTLSCAHRNRRPRGHVFAEVAPGACFYPKSYGARGKYMAS